MTSVLKIQIWTWSVFMLLLLPLLWRGFDVAWRKTYGYLSMIRRPGADALATQASARMIWIYMVYSYSFAYVRLICIVLTLALIFIILRLLLSLVPESSRLLKLFKSIASTAIDANILLEFMHYRHWKYHCTAMALYLAASLGQCFILLDAPTLWRADRCGHEFTRISLTSMAVMLVYYAAYIGRTMMMVS
jgi:hypothetical protein